MSRLSHVQLEAIKQANNVLKLQVRNNCLILYNQYEGERKSNKTTFKINTAANLITYTGEFTASAKKSLTKAIELLVMLNPTTTKIHPVSKKKFRHNLSFVTLTIPDNTLIHPTEAYKNLLRPFLQYLTKTHNMKYFIWKLEYQKRGQIHYHLTTDLILHWKIIRNKWNYLITKAGYNLEYQKEHNHTNANSTDIKKVYLLNNLVPYFQKEFIKSMQNENPRKHLFTAEQNSLKYKVWSCSDNIKRLGLFTTEIDNEQSNLNKLTTLAENDLA